MAESVPAAPDEEALSALREALAFRYPYESAVRLPSKLTATALPQDEPDADGERLAKTRGYLFRLPEFMDGERPLTGAERGTATHIVMQFIDFARTGTAEDIEAEITRLRTLSLLSERQAEAVDHAAIVRFFASETGLRIRTEKRVHREKRFSVLAPAGTFFPEGGNESVLLQGVVDCCIEEEDALTIIDYKTDYVTQETLDAAAAQYKRQILAYAYAMSRIFEKPVRSCVLCFLRAGLFAEIRPEA
jgi:ATP-dependent helicase/nuclease subunit A